MATAARNAMPYRLWLKAFKTAMREMAPSEIADELDGYLNTGDWTNYYEEGLTPQDAAENEYSCWEN